MPGLRADLVTPLTGKLALFGRESATALTLWAEHAADLGFFSVSLLYGSTGYGRFVARRQGVGRRKVLLVLRGAREDCYIVVTASGKGVEVGCTRSLGIIRRAR